MWTRVVIVRERKQRRKEEKRREVGCSPDAHQTRPGPWSQDRPSCWAKLSRPSFPFSTHLSPSAESPLPFSITILTHGFHRSASPCD